MGIDMKQTEIEGGLEFISEGLGVETPSIVVSELKRFFRDYFREKGLSFEERMKLEEGNDYEIELNERLKQEDFLLDDDSLVLGGLSYDIEEGVERGYSIRIRKGEWMWFVWNVFKGGGGSGGHLKNTAHGSYHF